MSTQAVQHHVTIGELVSRTLDAMDKRGERARAKAAADLTIVAFGQNRQWLRRDATTSFGRLLTESQTWLTPRAIQQIAAFEAEVELTVPGVLADPYSLHDSMTPKDQRAVLQRELDRELRRADPFTPPARTISQLLRQPRIPALSGRHWTTILRHTARHSKETLGPRWYDADLTDGETADRLIAAESHVLTIPGDHGAPRDSKKYLRAVANLVCLAAQGHEDDFPNLDYWLGHAGRDAIAQLQEGNFERRFPLTVGGLFNGAVWAIGKRGNTNANGLAMLAKMINEFHPHANEDTRLDNLDPDIITMLQQYELRRSATPSPARERMSHDISGMRTVLRAFQKAMPDAPPFVTATARVEQTASEGTRRRPPRSKVEKGEVAKTATKARNTKARRKDHTPAAHPESLPSVGEVASRLAAQGVDHNTTYALFRDLWPDAPADDEVLVMQPVRRDDLEGLTAQAPFHGVDPASVLAISRREPGVPGIEP